MLYMVLERSLVAENLAAKYQVNTRTYNPPAVRVTGNSTDALSTVALRAFLALTLFRTTNATTTARCLTSMTLTRATLSHTPSAL